MQKSHITNLPKNVQDKPIFSGIVKLKNGKIYRDGKFIEDDLWFDTCVKTYLSSDCIVKSQNDYTARIVDPQRRFWEASKYKDYAAHMEFDIKGLIAVPGYIDIQTNGAFGVDFTTMPIIDNKGVVKSLIAERLGLNNDLNENKINNNGDKFDKTSIRVSSPSHLDSIALNIDNTTDGGGFAHSETLPNTMLNQHLVDVIATTHISTSNDNDNSSSLPQTSDTNDLTTLSVSPSYSVKVEMNAKHLQTPSKAKSLLLAVNDMTQPSPPTTTTSETQPPSKNNSLMSFTFENDDDAFNDVIRIEDAEHSSAVSLSLHTDQNRELPHVPDITSNPSPSLTLSYSNSSHSTGKPHPFLYLANYDRDLREVGEQLPMFGVTSYCPTVISSSTEVYNFVCRRFRKYMINFELARGTGAVLRQSQMLGLHLEGPFISIKGAHDPNVIADPESFENVHSRYGGDKTLSVTSIVTLAPELPGSQEAIEQLSARGIVVSMGHSKATFSQATEAVDQGATLITHMFNAMTPFHHRDPGLIGILGAKKHQIAYSIIADGIHAHPASVNIAYNTNPQGTILVTDSMGAMGLDTGVFNLGEMDVEIKNNDKQKLAVVKGTSTLAGAIEPLDKCVQNFVDFTKCAPEVAIAAVTETPAKLLGIYPRKGSLCVGADADIVLLDPDTLQVRATIINGQLAYVDDVIFPPQPKPVSI